MNVEFKYLSVFGVTLVFISSCFCDDLLLRVFASDRKTTTGISQTLPAKSTLQCAVLFKATEHALSFNYNEGEQKCEIGENTGEDNEEADGWTLVVNLGHPCPIGWVHHEESCYLLYSKDKFNWTNSQVFCSDHNAHLAYIEDSSENIFVKGLMMQELSGKSEAHVWLGASDDASEGLYLWYGIEQPVTFTDWGPGEPNSVPLNINEDCLALWADYNWQWADFDCQAQCYFVCEKSVEESSVIVG